MYYIDKGNTYVSIASTVGCILLRAVISMTNLCIMGYIASKDITLINFGVGYQRLPCEIIESVTFFQKQ